MGETCKWTEDENGLWNTSCGDIFEITEGTPRENEMIYCTYCGKPLEEVAYHEITNNDALEQQLAAEREACAKICEREGEGHRDGFGQHCAAMIRSQP